MPRTEHDSGTEHASDRFAIADSAARSQTPLAVCPHKVWATAVESLKAPRVPKMYYSDTAGAFLVFD